MAAGEESSAYNFENSTAPGGFTGSGGYSSPSLYDLFMTSPDDLSASMNYGFTPETGANWDLSGMSGSGGFLSGGFTNAPSAFESFFDENPFGKALKGLGKVALNATPAGRVANLAMAGLDFAKNPSTSKGVGLASSMIGGLPGAALNAGYQGFANDNWGPAAGTLAANVVGRATGSGELANLAGQFANNATRAGMGDRQGVSPNQGPGINGQEGGGGGMGGEGFDIAPLAQGLMSLYGMSQANRGIKDAGKMNSAVQQQINQLSDMFSPTGVYANHMREVLARKDAAAGRNSQYGPREAQLMALLAEKQAQAANTIGNLAQTGQQNRFAAADRRNQLLGQGGALLMNLGRQSGLFDMFRNQGGGRTPQPEDYQYGGPSSGVYGQPVYIPPTYESPAPIYGED